MKKLIPANSNTCNFLLELNNFDVVREVIDNKHRFSYERLSSFSKAIEYTLTSNQVFETVQRDEKNPLYFDNYVNVRIPHQHQLQNDKIHGPIPDFYVLQSESADTLFLADSVSEYIVTPDDIHYFMYLAFKLALTPLGSFNTVLDYHRNKYFDDALDFTQMLQFMAALFKDILGERGSFIISDSPGTPVIDFIPTKLDDSRVEDKTEDSLETIENVTHREQILAIHYLLKHISNDYKSTIDKAELARFIIFLTGKKQYSTGTQYQYI